MNFRGKTSAEKHAEDLHGHVFYKTECFSKPTDLRNEDRSRRKRSSHIDANFQEANSDFVAKDCRLRD